MSATSTEAAVKDSGAGNVSHRGEAFERPAENGGESTKSLRARLRPYLFIAPLVVLSGFFIYYCIGFTVVTSYPRR